jgi:GT2 family glycosyltransferase
VTRTLSIGITTRDRPDALRACIESLAVVDHLNPQILIFDDRSSVPVERQLDGLDVRVRVLTDRSTEGYIAGRNRLMKAAEGELVLLLDDDARLLTAEAIEAAIATMRRDSRIGAIGFAQAEADGRPWPAAMQPSRATKAAVVPSFIGFAHLLRRVVFLDVGGYRESFGFYGEEKDFCLRLLEVGYLTVYLPEALVAHVPDPGGRSQQRYLRFVVRNDCFNTLYNDPISRVIWLLPARYALYFRMRHGWGIHDPWGWTWLLRELWSGMPDVVAHRRPVSRRTMAAWRALKRTETAYAAPLADAGGRSGI